MGIINKLRREQKKRITKAFAILCMKYKDFNCIKKKTGNTHNKTMDKIEYSTKDFNANGQ